MWVFPLFAAPSTASLLCYLGRASFPYLQFLPSSHLLCAFRVYVPLLFAVLSIISWHCACSAHIFSMWVFRLLSECDLILTFSPLPRRYSVFPAFESDSVIHLLFIPSSVCMFFFLFFRPVTRLYWPLVRLRLCVVFIFLSYLLIFSYPIILFSFPVSISSLPWHLHLWIWYLEPRVDLAGEFDRIQDVLKEELSKVCEEFVTDLS